MRQGKRTNLETALDTFGLPNGGRIQPASHWDLLGTSYRRLPSLRPLPSSDVGMASVWRIRTRVTIDEAVPAGEGEGDRR